MASDLISRKELKKFTGTFADVYNVKVAEMFRDIVNQQPTVDAVEVVRCKDCGFLQGCKNGQYLGLEGYCSHGAKMDGGKNND